MRMKMKKESWSSKRMDKVSSIYMKLDQALTCNRRQLKVNSIKHHLKKFCFDLFKKKFHEPARADDAKHKINFRQPDINTEPLHES